MNYLKSKIIEYKVRPSDLNSLCQCFCLYYGFHNTTIRQQTALTYIEKVISLTKEIRLSMLDDINLTDYSFGSYKVCLENFITLF